MYNNSRVPFIGIIASVEQVHLEKFLSANHLPGSFILWSVSSNLCILCKQQIVRYNYMYM